MSTESHKPLWLYPNLLSLDAPLVAMAWLYVFGKTWRQYLPWEFYACLGLAVWVIYAADRLLDAALRGAEGRLEARHRFHQKHRVGFGITIVVAFLTALILMLIRLPVAIYANLLLGGVLLGGFFGLSLFSNKKADEIPYTKNILAGITFAFGTAMTAHLYRSGYGLDDLLRTREFLSFAVLCVLNISAIDLWEHAARSADLEVKASDELALTLPLALLAGGALLSAVFDRQFTSRPFFYAVLTGAALLHIVNRCRTRFTLEALRVLADVALLAPVLVFIVANRSF